jgi:hypothetical protein
MMSAQFVTVPILDSRLRELKAETRIALASLEYKLSAAIQELSAKVDHRYAELDARIDRKWGELETAIERTKAELVRWLLLTMLVSVALRAGVTAALNAFWHVG